ncbi:unnamed protein product [Amoebophrya sp. A120]|nr:unnamed protein product [Amoebophrya sp. A120]|eukprot:GSA120T00006970001.1
MDCYKLVGFEEFQIKTKADLERVRQRVKKRWKALKEEVAKLQATGKTKDADAKKYEAAKLNEAFEQVQRRFNKPAEQLLGRSRKERELDGFYNHQSKEMKKHAQNIARIRQQEQDARRLHFSKHQYNKHGVALLPGQNGRPLTKEQLIRMKMKRQYLKLKAEKIKKQLPTVMNKPIDAIDMLKRVLQHIEQRPRFTKSMPFLKRWVEEQMDWDNRCYAFEAIQRLVQTGHACQHYESFNDVKIVFEKMLELNIDFVEKFPLVKILWQLILNHLKIQQSDDSFQMERCMKLVREFVAEVIQPDLEFNNSEEMRNVCLPKNADTVFPAFVAPETTGVVKQEEIDDVGENGGTASNINLGSNIAGGSSSSSSTTGAAGRAAGTTNGENAMHDISAEILQQEQMLAEHQDNMSVAGEDAVSVVGGISNYGGGNARIIPDKDHSSSPKRRRIEEEGLGPGAAAPDEPADQEPHQQAAAASSSPAGAGDNSEEESDEDDFFGAAVGKVNHDQLFAQEQELDAKSSGDGNRSQQNKPGPGASSVDSQAENNLVNENQENDEDENYRYRPPNDAVMKAFLRREFAMILESLFNIREKKLALRPLLDPYFQEVFYDRQKLGFSDSDIALIEEFQAAIKKSRAAAKQHTIRNVGIDNDYMKAQNPVVDGRSTKNMGTGEWGAGENN